MTTPDIIVIGFGNRDRQDDAAGLLVARSLRDALRGNADVIEAGGNVLELLNHWPAATSIILVDAVRTGSRPGTVHVWRGCDIPESLQSIRDSTHALSIPEVVRLARALHHRTPNILLVGIEASTFAPGNGLSPAVACAVPRAAECVVRELAHGTRPDEDRYTGRACPL